jgi:hypothetical protein
MQGPQAKGYHTARFDAVWAGGEVGCEHCHAADEGSPGWHQRHEGPGCRAGDRSC